MFVQVTDYHGNQIGIDPSKVIKDGRRNSRMSLRTRFLSTSRPAARFKGKLEKVVKLFGTYIRLAALHAPNDMPVSGMRRNCRRRSGQAV